MDLLDITVEFKEGGIGKAYMYRANLNLLLKKDELVSKYKIPENEVDDFIDLVRESIDADRFYDNED